MSSGAINQTGPGASAVARAAAAGRSGEVRLWGFITPTGLAMGVILTGLVVALFHHFLWSQALFSVGSQDWSHAFMVPLISVYILWQRRAELARAPVFTFWPGLVAVLASIPVYAFSQVRAVPGTHMVQGWSLILCVFGLVLLLTGPVVARIAFIPIAYLMMGITVSEKIMIYVTFRLQLLASQGAWLVLNVCGISTDVEGNVLNVHGPTGVHPLNVAEACSGMRMVIAFLALGVAVSVVGVGAWWKRVLLVVLAVPVALLMNILRVAVLGGLTLVDPNLAAGQSHMLIGTILLAVAFGIYMFVVWCLNRIVPEPEQPKPPARGAGAASIRWPKFARPGFVAAAGALIVGTVGVTATLTAMAAHLRKLPIEPPGDRKLHSIPTETATFIRAGADQQMSPEMVEELGTSNYLSRAYVRKTTPAGQKPIRLDLHLAYYTGMIDTVPHVPERCMVGAGWSLLGDPAVMPATLDSSRWTPERDAEGRDTGRWRARIDQTYADDRAPERVRLPRDPKAINLMVSEFRGPRGGRMFGGYFFIANGGHVARAEDVRLLAFDLKATYAFYLKVQISSPDVSDKTQLVDEASALLSELLPEIMRCVPDWAEVEAGTYPPGRSRRADNGQ